MVHINLETGLYRSGINNETALEIARRILNSKHLISKEYIRNRLLSLRSTNAFKTPGFFEKNSVPWGMPRHTVHLARSAAFLTRPDLHLGMARIGLLIYGVMHLNQGRSLGIQAGAILARANRKDTPSS